MNKYLRTGLSSVLATTCLINNVHAEVNNEIGSPQIRMAQAMAVADGITTYYGIHHKDCVEANKLMPSSKGGIAAITALKVGVITYYDYYGTPSQRDKVASVTSGTFGGAAVNNLLAASGVDSSVAVGAGVLSGIGLYYLNRNLANKFNGKNQIIAVNNGIGLQHRW